MLSELQVISREHRVFRVLFNQDFSKFTKPWNTGCSGAAHLQQLELLRHRLIQLLCGRLRVLTRQGAGFGVFRALRILKTLTLGSPRGA